MAIHLTCGFVSINTELMDQNCFIGCLCSRRKITRKPLILGSEIASRETTFNVSKWMGSIICLPLKYFFLSIYKLNIWKRQNANEIMFCSDSSTGCVCSPCSVMLLILMRLPADIVFTEKLAGIEKVVSRMWLCKVKQPWYLKTITLHLFFISAFRFRFYAWQNSLVI